MITATTTEDFNEVYDEVKNFFQTGGLNSIHNLLWQIIINRANEDKTMAFYDVYHEGEHVLARVEKNEPGFYNSHVEFIESLTDKQASLVCNVLNEKVFGISKSEADEIVDSSFRSQIKTEQFLK